MRWVKETGHQAHATMIAIQEHMVEGENQLQEDGLTHTHTHAHTHVPCTHTCMHTRCFFNLIQRSWCKRVSG